MNAAELAKHLDLADHHANTTPADIKVLCQNVLRFGFNSAFVNPVYVRLARDILLTSGKVGTVVSFPLGQDVLEAKLVTIRRALRDSADELDVSLNVSLIKTNCNEELLKDMRTMVNEVKNAGQDKIIKFIIETGFLTPEEIIRSSKLVLESGADFVKSDSGMGPRGATVGDMDLIKSAVGDKIRIKAAGGIETYDQAMALIEHGANRLGTSHAVEIVEHTPSVSGTEPSTSE
jgi:deoxyribose-phosphate aldolase